ncbi:MAG: hypothetical protein V1770_06235 [bacterium]
MLKKIFLFFVKTFLGIAIAFYAWQFFSKLLLNPEQLSLLRHMHYPDFIRNIKEISISAMILGGFLMEIMVLIMFYESDSLISKINHLISKIKNLYNKKGEKL